MTDSGHNGAAAADELTEPVTIPVEAYVSEEYARAERDKLWRKVWQEVGRVEDLPKVGSYLTYDILDDSIVVVRTGPDTFAGPLATGWRDPVRRPRLTVPAGCRAVPAVGCPAR